MPTDKVLPPSFDEALYLRTYPEVEAAVAAGQFASGEAHYLAFGRHEERDPGPLYTPPTSGADGVPYPPSDLIFLVTNGRDPFVFDATGAADLRAVRRVIRDAGLELPHNRLRVLDWGCGCGRLARHWKDDDKVDLFGCDINEALVSWCSENLQFGKFSVSDFEPPLRYADGSFDLLYGISVFTHLTFDQHYRWMLEIWRILAPGGVAVLTAHGPTFFPVILANLKDITTDVVGTIRTTLIDEDAFVAIERSAGSNFSANAMTGNMFARICQPFDVVAHKPRYGLMGVHDTYVITKKTAGPLAFIDDLLQAPLSGKRCTVTVNLSLAGQTHFSVLAHATNLFFAATLHVVLSDSGQMPPLAESAVLSLPERVSLTLLDAAHVLVTIDDLPAHHGVVALSAEVYSDTPMDGAALFLSKAMLF